MESLGCIVLFSYDDVLTEQKISYEMSVFMT